MSKKLKETEVTNEKYVEAERLKRYNKEQAIEYLNAKNKRDTNMFAFLLLLYVIVCLGLLGSIYYYKIQFKQALSEQNERMDTMTSMFSHFVCNNINEKALNYQITKEHRQMRVQCEKTVINVYNKNAN